MNPYDAGALGFLALIIFILIAAWGLVCWAARRENRRENAGPSDWEIADAQEAVNSCKAALHECEPTVRRVRAGS